MDNPLVYAGSRAKLSSYTKLTNPLTTNNLDDTVLSRM